MAKPKDVPDPQDVQDVMREEKSRGRRPVDTDKLRERRRIVQSYRRLLRINRKEDFVEAILSLGIKPGSEAFDEFLQTWDDVRRF